MQRCPNCSSDNPDDARFCRNCGTPLGSTPGAQAGLPSASDIGAAPTQAASAAQSGPAVVSAPDSYELQDCPRCGARTPKGLMFCQACGSQLPTLSEATSPEVIKRITQERDRLAKEAAASADGRSTVFDPGADHAAWGALVSVNRDGSDGETYPLAGESVLIGRDSELAFPDDPFMARVHARFLRDGSSVSVIPLDQVNGVLRRVTEDTVIEDGAVLLLGRELLRLELESEMREMMPMVQHGVTLFASPKREIWGRLVQIQRDGAAGEVRLLAGHEVVIGREEGDIVFADDEFLSRRHAIIKRTGGVCMLSDLGSSNGSFLRVLERAELNPGDHLRVGDQMFRFEPSAP